MLLALRLTFAATRHDADGDTSRLAGIFLYLADRTGHRQPGSGSRHQSGAVVFRVAACLV